MPNVYGEYDPKTGSVKRFVMKVDEDIFMWWKPSTMPKIIRALQTLAELPLVAEVSGTVEFGKDYKNKQRITIRPDDEMVQDVEYLIPRGTSLTVEHGARVEKGCYISNPPRAHANVWLGEDGQVYLTDGSRLTGERRNDPPNVREAMQRFAEITGGAREDGLVRCWVMPREEAGDLASQFEMQIALATAIKIMTRCGATDQFIAKLLRWGADLVERRQQERDQANEETLRRLTRKRP